MWNSPTIRNRNYNDRGCDDGGWDDPDIWPIDDELESPPIEPLTPPPTIANALSLSQATPLTVALSPTKYDAAHRRHQQHQQIDYVEGTFHCDTNKQNFIINHDLQGKQLVSSLTSTEHDNWNSPYQKKNVSFRNVIVYYFARSQGFVSVPTEGGSTLGMGTHHFMSQELNIDAHEQLRQKMHREILLRLRHAKARRRQYDYSSGSEDDFNENDYCDISDSDLNLDKFIFLRPLSIKNRRSLLRAAGIGKIDASEKRECKRIRDSRESTGCRCDGICNPASCECSRLGVNCHVDRESFPCGCSSAGCQNPSGRLEFDGKRVRTHFIDTLLRLGFGANLKTKDFNLLKERQVLHYGDIQCLNDRGQSNLLEFTTGLKGLEQQQGSNVEVESIEDIPETPYSFFEYELNQLHQNNNNTNSNFMLIPPIELENHNYVKRHLPGLTTCNSQLNGLISHTCAPPQVPQFAEHSTNSQSNIKVPSIIQTTHMDHPYIRVMNNFADARMHHFPLGQTSLGGDCNTFDTITMAPSSSNYNINEGQHQVSNCTNDQRYCAAVQSLCDHRYFTTNSKKVMLVNNNHLNSQNIDEYSKHIATRDGD